jgi:two-component system chemotaxis response regulator CheB
MAETLIEGKCRALIIGGSAGSLDVLLEIFPSLSNEIDFPIILVTHRKSGNDALLSDLLRSRTRLKVNEAEEKDRILHGNVYIAPADYHLLIEENETLN